MSAQRPSVAMSSDNTSGDFSAVATRLVEAACFARDGNREAVKAYIARAIALLRGEPSTIPTNLRPLEGDTRETCAVGWWRGRSGG